MNQHIVTSVERVQAALIEVGLTCKIQELCESARTSKEAADSIGCKEAHIVKSLIFQTKSTHQAVLILASGKNRIDEEKISDDLGQRIEKAPADFVRKVTGFAIGGVPPLAHATLIEHVFMDQDLMDFEQVWAAAGTPKSVFCITSKDLARITRAQILIVKSK